MPIVKISDNLTTVLTPEAYADEGELERLLESNPALLVEPGDPALSSVMKQYRLSGAGIADLFFVDSQGLPVLVEVKLARNPQSRREVIAQVFDYAATLAEQTVDEVDRDTDGRVETALRRMCSQDSEFKVRWQALAANLRSGTVRVIVAVDMESPDLNRIVGFIAAHSDLDVRLVVVEKYRDPAGGLVYSSTAVVNADTYSSAVAEAKAPAMPSLGFQAVLNAWLEVERSPLPLVGRSSGFRQVRVPDWPVLLHYEFLAGTRIGAEIHIEAAALKPLAPLLSRLAAELENNFEQAVCQFDPKWSAGRGRLVVLHEEGTAPEVIARNMRLLIEATRERITAALQGK